MRRFAVVLSSFCIFILSCSFSACGGDEPGPECRTTYDCDTDQMCDYGWCVHSYPTKIWDDTIVKCGCWGDALKLGEQRLNPKCRSGWDIVVHCSNWCTLGGKPMSRICKFKR